MQDNEREPERQVYYMARSYNGFKYVKTLAGTPPAMGWITLTGGSFYEGEVLRISASSGKGALFANSGTAAAGVLAADCTTAATDRSRPYYLADSQNVFEAINTTAVTLPYCLGDKFTVNIGSTHAFHVTGTALAGNATACVRCVGYHPDEVTTSATGKRLWVVFINQTSLYGDASTSK
jgi:hypothetical protein